LSAKNRSIIELSCNATCLYAPVGEIRENARFAQAYWTDLFINDRSRYHLGETKSQIAGTNGSDDFPGFCRSTDRAASTRSGNRHSLCSGARSCSCSCGTRSDFLRGNCTIQSGVTPGDPRRMTAGSSSFPISPFIIQLILTSGRLVSLENNTRSIFSAVKKFHAWYSYYLPRNYDGLLD